MSHVRQNGNARAPPAGSAAFTTGLQVLQTGFPASRRERQARSKASPEFSLFAIGPRSIPRGFRIAGGEPARILLMTTGSDLAYFIAEMSVSMDTPPTALDMVLLMATAERHRITILGPLPQ